MAQQSESVTDTEPVCKDCNLGFEDRDWNRLPLKYVPCHKRKYSFPKSERFQLNPGNIQAGKPGDPSKIANCVMVAPCTNEPLILPPEQQYIREFLTKVAKVIPSKVAKEMMVKEFGLFDYEADRLIKKLRTSPKKVATLNLDARECWLEEYKRLMSVKLTDYLATVMSARRTKRTRHIAATLLNHFCDLTGEYCNLNNPRNRVQRIQVYIADRIAIWLADIMAKIDKEMCKDYIEKVQNDLDSEENKIDESQEESKEESEKDKKPAKKTKTKPSNKSKKDAEKKKKKEEEDKVKKKEADKKKEDEKKKKEADKKKKEAEKKKKEADAKKEADEKKKEAENKKKESEKKKKEGEKKKEAAKKKEEKEKDEEKKKQEEEKKKKESEKIKEQKKKEEEKKKEEKKKEEKEEKKKEKEEEKKEEEKKEKTEKKNEPEKKKSEKKGSVKNEAEKKKEADKKKKPSENKKKETTKKKEAEKKKVADKKKEPEKKKKEPPKKKEGEEAKKAEEEDKKKDDEKPKEEVEKKEEDEKEIEKPKEEDKKAEGDKQEVEKPQEEEKKEVEKPKEEEKKKVEEPKEEEKKEEEKKEEEKKEDEKKEVEEVPIPSDEAKKEDEKKEVEEVPKPADEAKKEDEKKVDEPIEEAKKEDAEEVKKPTEEDKKIELDEKTKDDEHGEGDGDVTQDPLDALETLIPVTKSAEALTPAEERVTEVIKDQIKHELGGDLTPQDEAALADISGKISSWVVDSLEKGKKELTERPPEGKVTYYISRPVGECYYNVRKIDDRQACAVAKSARLERVAVISESICKTPTNLMPAQSTKEMKEWAKWAANVVDLAEKWATWIDKTCDEAETKAKAGKEGNVEWEKFKRTTQSHAYELRRNKRFVKESAEAWKKKYSQIPR